MLRVTFAASAVKCTRQGLSTFSAGLFARIYRRKGSFEIERRVAVESKRSWIKYRVFSLTGNPLKCSQQYSKCIKRLQSVPPTLGGFPVELNTVYKQPNDILYSEAKSCSEYMQKYMQLKTVLCSTRSSVTNSAQLLAWKEHVGPIAD